MNPSFKVPSRREVSGTLLSQEDEATTARVLDRIKAAEPRSLTLVTDGWTDVNGDSVINYIVCDPKPMFFDSVAPKERHTGKTDILSKVHENVNKRLLTALTQ